MNSKPANPTKVTRPARGSRRQRTAQPPAQQAAQAAAPHSAPPTSWFVYVAAALIAGALVWSYWPILTGLVHAWRTEDDYTHGFLVVPFALYLLWARRARRPTRAARPALAGLLLIAAALALRVLGGWLYIDALAAWSLPIWLGGVCWLFAGRRMLVWALPALAFLVFMIPLPYRVEQFLSLPLQSVATRMSCWMLECLGQPAVAEGHVILINDVKLEVAQACSGLRMFVSIFALAFAYAVLSDRPWWTKPILFICAAPIAMLANSIRIAATGMIYQVVTTDAGRQFVHEAGGLSMIPLAALLMGLLLWYLSRLFVAVETPDPLETLRRRGIVPAA